MKELYLSKVELREIKSAPITKEEIETMHELAGSYDALFSKKAMKYKSMGLKEKNLSENDLKKLILEEYTFLKRPVLVFNKQIAVGNSKQAVEDMKQVLG